MNPFLLNYFIYRLNLPVQVKNILFIFIASRGLFFYWPIADNGSKYKGDFKWIVVINRILLRRNWVCLRLGALYDSGRIQGERARRSGPENPDLFGASYEGRSPWKYISFVEKDEGAWTARRLEPQKSEILVWQLTRRNVRRPFRPLDLGLFSRPLPPSLFLFLLSLHAWYKVLSPVRLTVRPWNFQELEINLYSLY